MKGKVFNAQEVQSMLNGSKVMFREVVKKPFFTKIEIIDGKRTSYPRQCPYKVGQKIFVKESFDLFAGQVAYKQGLVGAERYLWKPAQRMKQEHSRITLLIKEIRVERLASISEEDCKKEGFKTDYKMLPHGIFKKDGSKFFMENWNATHKKPEEKFDANPWVWVVEFEVVNN